MKKLRTIFIIIGLLAALIFLKDLLIKLALEEIARSVTGLEISSRAVEIGIIRPYIKVEGLVILNNDKFPDKVMFDVPLIYIEYDPAAIQRNNIKIKDISFNLRLLNVVKNKNGEINLDSLNIVKNGADVRPIKDRFKFGTNIFIERLHLVAGKVTYKDYSQPPHPKITEFHIGIDEKYESIKDPYMLGRLILSHSLKKTNVPQIAGFDISIIDNSLGGIISKGADVMAGTKNVVTNISGNMAEKAVETFNNARETIRKAFPRDN